MKLLHTADLHVGKMLGRQSRLRESEAVLAEIIAIAEHEDVDVVLIAGDVFEHKVPSPEAEAVLYRALVALESRDIHVIIVTGNHDAPERWDALRPLLGAFRIHCASGIRRPDDGGILEIAIASTGETLQVAALPWVSPRRCTSAMDVLGISTSSSVATYADGMKALMHALCAPLSGDACTIFAGHVMISGARPGTGERTLTLGQVYGIDAVSLPQVQYAALGHIHRPQTIEYSGVPARYAGSPMQMDFGELGYDTSVTIVELKAARPARFREVPLTSMRRLLDVSGTMDELAAQTDTVGDAWLRVTLRCERPQPGMAEQVREILPGTIEVRLDYVREERTDAARPRIRTLSSRQQFERFLTDRYGTEPDAADLDLFDELLEAAQGGAA